MPGWELVGEEEKQAALAVFNTLPPWQFFTNRQLVREFEQAFAASLGVPDAVAVSSGTAALKCALKALGVGRGDEVITQAHTFVATVEAIVDCGATPVIVEINESLNMDPKDLAKKITPKTKVILPVHMLGAACDMSQIMTIASNHGVKVLEDTAQACHGTYHGWPLGTIGDVGAFSFSYSKMLTTGEGGMVVGRDPSVRARTRAYSDHGHDLNPLVPSRGQDTHTEGGFNFRMASIPAVVGKVQLTKLDASIKVHREHQQKLKKALGPLSYRHVADPSGDIGDALCFFLDTEVQAQKVARHLFEKDGLALKNLPDALNWHCASYWDHLLGSQAKMLTASASILQRTIAIQVCYRWTDDDIQRVAKSIHAAIKEAV